ncbi:MAG: hypothetical protein DRP89_02380 [Candidatus Neomarinimicrobiota bacterium]|nr:MAG: hypothetical protein DRP89_02380 [Candidatus Neomarinimicrobiota bacterium]
MFYEELKKKRESLGLTIEQISNKTKINKNFLQAFESGDFSALPYAYTRLFLKAYATEVEMDPKEVLNAFNEYMGKKESTPQIPPPAKEYINITKKNSNTIAPKKKINIATLTVVVLVVVFLIMILKQVLIDEENKNISSVPVGSSDITLQGSDSSSAPVITDKESTAQQGIPLPSKNLSLVLKTQDACWIKLIIDSKDTSETTFPANIKKEWTASKRYDLRLGKPSVVSLSLNGKDLGKLGANGIPTRLVITKDGIIRRQSLLRR